MLKMMRCLVSLCIEETRLYPIVYDLFPPVTMSFKIVLSDPKSKKAYQKEADEAASGLVGKKIGDTVKADFLGLAGYEIQVTGGSDKDGFPMRRDLEGVGRKKILLSGGVGFHPLLKGQRKRKSVRGNTVSNQISQINAKISKYGDKSVEELLGVKPKEEKKEEKKELTEDEKRQKKAEEAQKLSEQMTDKPKRASKSTSGEPEIS